MSELEKTLHTLLRDKFAMAASEEDIEEYRGNRHSRHGQYTLTRTQARYSFADAMIETRKNTAPV